jgi:hypothetical protein
VSGNLLENGKPQTSEVRSSDSYEREITGLEAEIDRLKNELEQERREGKAAKSAVKAIQKHFKADFMVLRAVFGEIEAVGLEDEPGTVSAASPSAGKLSPRWEMLKQRLGGRQGEFIDILQHGEMSAAQVRAAAHCDIRTAYAVLQKMKDAGLVSKNGGKFSLKEL